MLSRLSRTASRLLDVHWSDLDDCHEATLSYEDGDDITFQRALSELSNHVPDASLEHVVGYCGKLLNPLCKYVGSTLSSDVECLVRTMQEADVQAGPSSSQAQECNEDDEDDEPIYLISRDTRHRYSDFETQPYNSKFKKVTDNLTASSPTLSSPSHEPLPSSAFVIPRIVITPAPPHPHDVSSLVPIQNAAFGSRLTVPSHISLNAAFPPMARTASFPSIPTSAVHRWIFENGHWCADVPKILEQERLGLFSRPVGLRRRAKACGRTRKPRTLREIGVYPRARRDP